jgi:two-component system, chemotaxis family, protein-glutamate methylesterase/glutaminase
MRPQQIKVLVVEDSLTMRALLVHAIECDQRLHVSGEVTSGEEAVERLKHDRPDVILMDIHLPRMNGFEATRRIMQTHPVPIVICSAIAEPDVVATTFEAIHAGALAVVAKPGGPGTPLFEASVKHLVDTLRLMSEIKVVRRWRQHRSHAITAAAPLRRVADGSDRAPKIVAIGTSTGGPPVLRTILAGLTPAFPAPVLVVQHISRGFLPGLVEWLTHDSKLPIHIATQGERPLPGHVYFAPDGSHLGVDSQGQFALTPRAPDDVLCPSVSHLFNSLAEVYGAGAVAVLLTGMGKDGARELALLKEQGATTIAQDKKTSVVHGMPGEAIRLQGATYVLPDTDVAATLVRLFNQS